MRIVPSLFGVFLGWLAVGTVVGVTSLIVLQQISRTPAKPEFAKVAKDSSKAELQTTEDDSYPALVVYQGDLMLRDTPNSDGKVVDKLRFDDTVIVVGQSEDGQWQQVRFEAKGTEGWVGNGNLKRAQ